VVEEKSLILSKVREVRHVMRSRLPAEVLGQRHETGLPTSPDLPAAAKRAIPSRRDTSRSVAETSADEMELVLTVISGRDKKRRVRKKKVSSDTRSEKTTTSAGPKTFAEATVRPPSTAMRWWWGGDGRGGTTAKKGADRPTLPRVPQCFAVALPLTRDSDYGLADALAKARRDIKLAELGITALRPKRALTGALILEIEEDDRRSTYGGGTPGRFRSDHDAPENC
jgi:hypothetical protein